jgi:hypothetical protein
MVSRVPFMGALAFVAPYRRSVPGSVLLSDQQSMKSFFIRIAIKDA